MNNYIRGTLPQGLVIAEMPKFVGNDYNGFMSRVIAIKNDVDIWICFPQATSKTDFASYLLIDTAPPFVRNAAIILGVIGDL